MTVSFWGSGSLKIVIPLSKITPRNRKIGWIIITPSVGVNQRTNICSHHMCTYRGGKQRTSR